jgi:hypothetical protein
MGEIIINKGHNEKWGKGYICKTPTMPRKTVRKHQREPKKLEEEIKKIDSL